MSKNINISSGEATIEINKKIYSKEILIQTCYVMLDECYFLLDEKEKTYVINITPKKKIEDSKLKELSLTFLDELIESASYIDQLKRTSEIRQIILEKALLPQQKEDE